MADLSKDERYTPRVLVEALHREFNFTVDAASCPVTPAAQVIGRFWDKDTDGLTQDWDPEVVWCNPPFSAVKLWVKKAHESKGTVVMLIPANRTEQGFWQEYIEPHRDRGGVLTTRFIAKRTVFGTPDAPEGKQWNSSAPFGCVLLIWDRRQE